MNASTIFGTKEEEEKMTLQQKLDAIDLAMANAQAQANDEAAAKGQVAAPVDPSMLTICDGCE